jgi:hypothetical protein
MTRVLICPITITPTKALTPSHVKGLLWVDVMYRATALAADVTYRYSNTTFNTAGQTLGFWEFLDRTFGDLDYSTYSEEQIGKLYLRYHAEQRQAPFDVLRPYLRAVENSGWVHPASAALTDLWRKHYAVLGMHDPGLAEVQHPAMRQEEVLEFLRKRALCLDNRASGGPVYLDGTRSGLPLRQIVTADNQPNYLVGALRELIPLANQYDEIVLVHDRELTEDYLLLQRILLAASGANVVREVIDRVPINGEIKSSRHGGWEDCTLPAMLAACQNAEPEALRLGMRLYFIAILGRGSTESFNLDLLRRTVQRASRLLAAESPKLTDAELTEYVRRYQRDQRIDPYRLTSSLLAGRRNPPVRDVAESVYC